MNNIVTTGEAGNLDLLATRIKNDIDRIGQSRDAWVENTLDLAEALAEARNHFKADRAFSQWLEDNQFLISHQDRAALIAFGQDIERAKVILGQTESRSVRMIYSKEFRITNAGKPKNASARKGLTITPETQKALGVLEGLKAAGVMPTQSEVQERAGVSNTAVRRAFTIVKTRESILEQDPDLAGMPKSWAGKYESAVRRKVAQLEAEYDRRRMQQVQKHIDEYLLPLYRDKLEKAERALEFGKKPFTVDEYRQLLAALHPDSTVENRTRAFIMVKEREYLLRPPERNKPFTSDLPQTLEELLKRRKKR